MAATTSLFEAGPDDGPDARIFEGAPEGLVLFRNELTHIFLPGQAIGRIDAATGSAVTAQGVHFEETFQAALANTVDNFRSLQPLHPRTYNYEIQLPTTAGTTSDGRDDSGAPARPRAN